MPHLLWLVATVVLAGIGVLGDYYIKLSGQSGTIISKTFLFGLVVYATTAFGWFFVMQHVKLGTLGVFYAVSTVLLLAVVGAVFFHENFNWYEILGILLAIVSLVLLSRFG